MRTDYCMIPVSSSRIASIESVVQPLTSSLPKSRRMALARSHSEVWGSPLSTRSCQPRAPEYRRETHSVTESPLWCFLWIKTNWAKPISKYGREKTKLCMNKVMCAPGYLIYTLSLEVFTLNLLFSIYYSSLFSNFSLVNHVHNLVFFPSMATSGIHTNIHCYCNCKNLLPSGSRGP